MLVGLQYEISFHIGGKMVRVNGLFRRGSNMDLEIFNTVMLEKFIRPEKVVADNE